MADSNTDPVIGYRISDRALRQSIGLRYEEKRKEGEKKKKKRVNGPQNAPKFLTLSSPLSEQALWGAPIKS